MDKIYIPENMGRGRTVLEVRNISKVFPGGVVAADKMNLELKAGEIHALLGENGAGKTTLMNILYGYFQPDAGEIYFHGEKVNLRSPKNAIDLGIGMVHQHFTLVPTLTVTENIVLGQEINRGFFLDLKKSRNKVKELSKKYGLKIDPDAEIEQLSAGEKQRVEILKALYRNVKILALDEPTVSLTPRETDDLMETLKTSVKKENITIIFITHKLTEALKISDRITVLRKGKSIGTIDAVGSTERSLAKMMVGKDVIFDIEKEVKESGKEVLRIENLSVFNDKGFKALNSICLSLYEGEILGIAGVSGNGQSELAQAIMGLREVSNGRIIALEKDITNDKTEEVIKHGIGYIPEDRKRDGSIGSFSVVKNLLLNVYTISLFTKNYSFPASGLEAIKWKDVGRYCAEAISEYNIVCLNQDALASQLSGGNLQKCILARELNRNPKILIAQNPTKGLDIGAIEFVRRRLLEQRGRGTGIILISEDLDEIMNISDRIAVINGGRIIGIVSAEESDKEEIGLMMSGVK